MPLRETLDHGQSFSWGAAPNAFWKLVRDDGTSLNQEQLAPPAADHGCGKQRAGKAAHGRPGTQPDLKESHVVGRDKPRVKREPLGRLTCHEGQRVFFGCPKQHRGSSSESL